MQIIIMGFPYLFANLFGPTLLYFQMAGAAGTELPFLKAAKAPGVFYPGEQVERSEAQVRSLDS